ncbi:MAG TPA: phospholipid carrier-dependent glycosyltransferase [Mycobacteriales bacterium]|nr:phospholipid carrier-dependent glycosyltransferase [Mycobacteriales bacterium]
MSDIAVTPAAADVDREALRRVRDRLVRPMPADRWLGWLLPLGLTAIATALRFWRITRPGSKVFDETYYAHDAWNLLKHGVELNANNNDTAPGFVVHPPLGKWMIAVGEGIFGNNPLGWRFSSAVIGSLAILMIARIARRLFRSTLLGCVAAILLMFDGLEFVQSRVSMLDIFLMFWILAAFGCLLLDRDHGRRRLADRLDVMGGPLNSDRRGPWLGGRPWRWACGFCLGAATATKWDGVFWIPLFLALALFWDWGARRTAGSRRPLRDMLLLDGLLALAPFVLLVVVMYVGSWTGWFLSDGAHAYDHDRYVRAGQSWFTHDRAVLGGWLRYQWEIWNFHSHLDAAHPYLSRPWGWLLLARPVAYFYASPHTCGASACSQEVLGIGTPALWWMSIPALVVVLWRAVARFDWRAAAILLAFLAGYLPWFYEDHEHRTMFLFYLLPSLPFMVLAVTMGIGLVLGHRTASQRRRAIGAVVAGAYLLAVIGNFAYFYPVLSGKVITYDQWNQRMWLHSCGDKDRNQHHEVTPCWI